MNAIDGGAKPCFRVRRLSAALDGNGDSVALGNHLQGLGEAEALHLHHEVEDVSAFAAAEALVDLQPLVDIERGGLFVVEGTQAGVVVRPAFL